MNDEKKDGYFEYRNVTPAMYKNPILRAWIHEELDSKDINILEYGCGFGQNMSAFSANGYKNIFGVDIEKNAIEFCCKNGFDVRELDVQNLKNPFDFKFDVILANHVIEHIEKEKIINTLSFIRKNFLKDNGKLLISVPNAQSNTGSYWRWEDWTHTTLFTSGSLYYVLRASGFKNVEFLDIDCTMGMRSKRKKFFKQLCLKLYIANKNFWNFITSSSYHKPSTQIFSYEIKCKAYNETK